MSDEHLEPEIQPWIDPELEARVVAWVVGEASEFEAAELERLVAEKPELGIFKRRIEAVHGLVGAASGWEPGRMGEERRARLIETLGSGEKAMGGSSVVAIPQLEGKPARRVSRVTVIAAAAMILFAAILVSISVPKFVNFQSANLQYAANVRSAADKEAAARAMANRAEYTEAGEPGNALSIFGRDGRSPAISGNGGRLAALDSLKAQAGGSISGNITYTKSGQISAGTLNQPQIPPQADVRLADAGQTRGQETATGHAFGWTAGDLKALSGGAIGRFEGNINYGAPITTVDPATLGLHGGVGGGAAAQAAEPAAPLEVHRSLNFSLGTSTASVDTPRLTDAQGAPAQPIASADMTGGAPPADLAAAPASSDEFASTSNMKTDAFGSQEPAQVGAAAAAQGGFRDGGKPGTNYAIGGFGGGGGGAAPAVPARTIFLGTNTDADSNNAASILHGEFTVNSPPPSKDKQVTDELQQRTSTGAAADNISAIRMADAATAPRSNNAQYAYSETRSELQWHGDNSWQMPVQKFDLTGTENQNNIAIGVRPTDGLESDAAVSQFTDAKRTIKTTGIWPAAVAAAAQTSPAQQVQVPIPGDMPLLGSGYGGTAVASTAGAAAGRHRVDRSVAMDILLHGKLPAPTPVAVMAPIGEVSASEQAYSTFSLHVSDASFQLAREALDAGRLPDPDSIRAEEFYNAFDYGDPAPAAGEKIACHIEQAAHPLIQERNLVRIAARVAAAGRGAGQPLRLTVLLDTSGSMQREDRVASVRQAMHVLASLLGPGDTVTLIGFARHPRLLAEEIRGDDAGKATIDGLVAHTAIEGGTNMEEALKLASELALRHLTAGAQNRVVMLTDGAANLGDADPAQLSKLVEQLRQKVVSFDACGVGAEGLNDDILEALTRKGGGRYYILNKPEDADAGFARQLAGAFRPAAENVKMQVRFNASRVGKYRLIGFEKHRLNQEDFRNDQVTAAQLASEEAAVALYQVQTLPEGEGEIGEVFVRFRDPATGQMVEQSWTIPYDAHAPALDKATPGMQLAATASLLAEKLRGGPVGDAIDLDPLAPIVATVRNAYPDQQHVQQFSSMYEQARRMMPRQ